MTGQDVIDEVRHLLNEQSEGFWTDAEFLLYLNGAIRDLADRLPYKYLDLLRQEAEIAAVILAKTLNPDGSAHPRPSNFLKHILDPERRKPVMYDYTGTQCQYISFTDLWSYQIMDAYTPTTKHPIFYERIVGSTTYFIICPSTEGARLPYIKEPTDKTSAATALQLDNNLKEGLVLGVCYQGLKKDKSQLAEAYRRDYEAFIAFKGGKA